MSSKDSKQTNKSGIIKKGVRNFLSKGKEEKQSSEKNILSTSPTNSPIFALSSEFSKEKIISFRIYAATLAGFLPDDFDFKKNQTPLTELSKIWTDYVSKYDATEKQRQLQLVVTCFNKNYNLWNDEFENESLKRKDIVIKTLYIPYLEKVSKSKILTEFEDFINNVVEAVRESQPFQEYGLEKIYITNLITRCTDNLHKLGVSNIINPILHLIKIVLVRYKTPFSSNIKNNEQADPEQSYIQILLANCFQILLNCITYQGTWNKVKTLKIKEIDEVIRESKKEAAKQGGLLVLKGYLDHLNMIINTYGPLSGSQVDFQFLLLNTIGAMLFRSSVFKSTVSQIGLLEGLFGWLSWPEKSITSPTTTVAENPKLQSEFDLQLLCLRVIQESIGPNCVERISSIGGWDRIMELILWTTEVFSINPSIIAAEKENTSENIIQSSSSASQNNWARKSNTTNNANLKLNRHGVPQSEVQAMTIELKHIFDVLFGMCEKVDLIDDNEEGMQNIILNTNRYIIKVISDIFNDDYRPTPSNLRVRHKLKEENQELQIVSLQFIRDLLSIHPESISFCSRFCIWDVLFTEYFFYCGIHSEISSSTPLPEFKLKKFQSFIAIRYRVLKFIQFAASMDDHDNIEECRKLFFLLNSYHTNEEIVINVLDSFLNICKNNRRATQNSIMRLNANSVFSMILSEYFLLFRQMSTRPQYTESDSEAVVQVISKTIMIFNSLLLKHDDMCFFLIRDHRLISEFYSLLYDPILREYPYHLILNLMTIKFNTKRSEEDNLELIKFYSQFFAVITKVQKSALITNFELILMMMHGIRTIISNSIPSRKLFKESNAFQHLINAVDAELSPPKKDILCFEVLKTFTVLMANSEKNKTFMRSFVGYHSLVQIISSILTHSCDSEMFHRARSQLLCNLHPSIYADQPPADLNHSIVSILMDMLVDGGFDINLNYEIQNGDIIPLIFNLFPAFSLPQREEIITNFTNIVGKCPLNQSLCARQYLIFSLLEMLPTINRQGDLMGKLISLIETLGSYNITVKELKRKFSLLSSESGNFRPWIQNRLLKSLQFMALSSNTGPVSFFDFDGKTSSLILPPMEKWPHSHGYTFFVWFRVESFKDNTTSLQLQNDNRNSPQLHQPRLVSFLDENEMGLEMYLVPISSTQAKLELSIKLPPPGKNSTHLFNDTLFNDRRWYLLSVTHISHRNLRNLRIHNENEIKVYINGELIERQMVKYPQFTKALTNIRIGASSKGGNKNRKSVETHNHFYGQIGPFLLFDDHLTQSQIKLVNSSCVDRIINSHGTSCFGEVESKIFLYYDATARSGKFFLDLTPEKNRERRMDAKGSGNLHSSVIRDVKDIIHCLGGIKVLFPIFAQLDQPLAPESPNEPIDYNIDKYILQQSLALLFDMLHKSETNVLEMVRSQGFSVISYLVERLSPEHLTTETVVAMEDHITKIQNCPNPSIIDDLLIHIVFNWRIWINASNQVQLDLIRLLLNYIKRNTEYMRKIFGVQKLFDLLSFFFWYDPKGLPSNLPGMTAIYHPVTKKLQGQRPSEAEIMVMRKNIMSGILYYFNQGITEQDVQALVRAIVECQDKKQLHELLTFIQTALSEQWPNFKELLMSMTSTTLFVLLLRNDDEAIRICNLSILIKLFNELSLNIKPKKKEVEYMAIGRILGDYPVTPSIYKCIFGLLVHKPVENTLIIDEHVVIKEIPVLPLLFKLLVNSPVLIRQKALQDIYLLISNNEENREILLQFEGWQLLIFSVLGTTNFDDPKAVLEIIYNICKILILHSFNREKLAFTTLQHTIAAMMVLSTKNILDHVEVTRNLLTKIFTALISQYKSRLADKRGSVSQASFLSSYINNLVYISLVVEEFLFFTPSAQTFATQKLVSTCPHIHYDISNGSNNNGSNNNNNNIQASEISPNGEWADLEMARKYLDAISTFKLLDTATMQSVDQIIKDSPKNSPLKNGGIHRIILKVLLFTIREGDVKVCVENVPRIRLLLDRDLANSKIEISNRLSFALASLLLINHRIVNEKPDEISKSKVVVPITKDLLRACAAKLPISGSGSGGSGSVLSSSTNSGSGGSGIGNTTSTSSGLGSSMNLAAQLSQMNMTGGGSGSGNVNQSPPSSPPNPSAAFFATSEFQYLSESCTIKEFTSSFSQSSGPSSYWAEILQWARSIMINCDADDRSLIPLIDKKRSKFINLISNYSQRDQKLEIASEKKIAQFFEDVNAQILQPEIERKNNELQKMENLSRSQQRLWRNIYRSLTNERGPWCSSSKATNIYWKLNKTENFSRMRLKLKRNYNFDPHSDAARDAIESSSDDRTDELPNSKIKGHLKLIGDDNQDLEEIPTIEPSPLLADDNNIAGSNNNNDGNTLNSNVNIFKLIYSSSCELISPLNVTPGKLEISLSGIYFKEDSEVSPKEVFIPLDFIRDIHFRRYLLRQSALEIFQVDRSNYFFNFAKRERDKIYSKILSLNPPNLVSQETGLKSVRDIIRKKAADVTRKWQQRIISNFDYLMYLNTLAGRTYNDITQYPVFPWVLSNYESDTIDLNDPANYRDLSKPIGALNPKRLEMFIARYENFNDPDIPQFHYGSHYSSSGIVLFYLIRAEPFTTQFLKLQGGKFDHADRMFDTIPKCWHNVLNASSDVKELIPEFFYFPDFLSNANKFNLGCKQGGVPMGDVGLPPWAKSPQEFIRINRLALESEYVSTHLHEWIDLIFGYKQRGRDAIDSFNVFYYLTYEGAVDIDSIEDEDQKKATIAQIDNFGQTPTQLFTKSHPPRLPIIESHQSIFYRLANKQLSIKTYPITITTDAISYVCLLSHAFNCSPQLNTFDSDFIITVTENRYVGVHKISNNINIKNVSSVNISSSPPTPFLLEIDNLMLSRKKIGAPFASDHSISNTSFATSLDAKIIVSCGHWDYSIKVSWIDNSKPPQSLVKHKDIVTCLAMGRNGKTFVTGSKDTTLLVWDVIYAKGSPLKVEDNPIHVLYGHNDEVRCVDIDVGLDVCASGSNDGTVIIHDLHSGVFIRSISHPNNSPIDLIIIASTGVVAFFSRKDTMMYVYHINGEFVTSLELKENIETFILSQSSQFLVTGSVEGQICFRSLQDLKLIHKVSVNIKICSIALSSDETYLFAGLGDGTLLAITVDDKVKSPSSVAF